MIQTVLCKAIKAIFDKVYSQVTATIYHSLCVSTMQIPDHSSESYIVWLL